MPLIDSKNRLYKKSLLWTASSWRRHHRPIFAWQEEEHRSEKQTIDPTVLERFVNDKDYRPEKLKQWLTDLSKAKISLHDGQCRIWLTNVCSNWSKSIRTANHQLEEKLKANRAVGEAVGRFLETHLVLQPVPQKKVIFVALVIGWYLIRYKYARRSRREGIVWSARGPAETALLLISLAGLGLVPLVYIATAIPRFATSTGR